ncbi:Hypothetical predicted protein [Podarcis lilfordi]|uniref:Uncharacterized protein n=1 Tax=Podarcis lilfordi TaxID=74358 RepID=A0AA35KIF1_9SAUR|nr:Hypothetical predicted protein [Podarcis lilfordi]
MTLPVLQGAALGGWAMARALALSLAGAVGLRGGPGLAFSSEQAQSFSRGRASLCARVSLCVCVRGRGGGQREVFCSSATEQQQVPRRRGSRRPDTEGKGPGWRAGELQDSAPPALRQNWKQMATELVRACLSRAQESANNSLPGSRRSCRLGLPSFALAPTQVRRAIEKQTSKPWTSPALEEGAAASAYFLDVSLRARKAERTRRTIRRCFCLAELVPLQQPPGKARGARGVGEVQARLRRRSRFKLPARRAFRRRWPSSGPGGTALSSQLLPRETAKGLAGLQIQRRKLRS